MQFKELKSTSYDELLKLFGEDDEVLEFFRKVVERLINYHPRVTQPSFVTDERGFVGLEYNDFNIFYDDEEDTYAYVDDDVSIDFVVSCEDEDDEEEAEIEAIIQVIRNKSIRDIPNVHRVPKNNDDESHVDKWLINEDEIVVHVE